MLLALSSFLFSVYLPHSLTQPLYAGFRKTLGPDHHLCTARMGPVKTYLISGSQNIQAMFKSSRQLSSDELERQIMKSVFGTPDRDVDIVQQPARNDVGQIADMGKRNRMFDIEKIYQNFLLPAHAVNSLTCKFTEVLAMVLDHESRIPPIEARPDEKAEWVTVNFYDWFKAHMFKASTTAFMGSRVLEMNPNLAEDFWVFDENMLKLFYGLPRFLARKGHEARDRLTEGMIQWLEDAKEKGDVHSTEDWDPYFGSRFLRAREQMDQKMGLGVRTRAGIKVGLLFA